MLRSLRKWFESNFQDVPDRIPESDLSRLSFIAEDSRFAVQNIRYGAIIAITLVFLFLVVDQYLYPQFFTEFLIIRSIGCFAIFLIFLVSFTRWARRNYQLLSTVIPSICALIIGALMIVLDDASSSYYAGMNLCIVGTGTLFHRAGVTSIIIFGIFLAVTLPSVGALDPMQKRIYIGSIFFVFSTAVLVVYGTRNHHKMRFSEFKSRSNLRRNHLIIEERNQKLRDTLSALKTTERQLFQSEKMGMMGKLSAAVIHEIANPLSFTDQALYYLKDLQKSDNPDMAEVEETLEDIQEGIDRIRNIIDDLYEFTHLGKHGGEEYPIADSVHSALKFIRKSLRENNVALELALDEDIRVSAVKNQVTQVITNILLNSIHALENQRIKTLKVSVQPDEIESMAHIVIEDNGPGMDEETEKNIFIPFFTTKDPGVGTGLGLSIAYRMIEVNDGRIEVETAVGEGTTFRVSLPLVGKQLAIGGNGESR